MVCPRICFINGLSNCIWCSVHCGSSIIVQPPSTHTQPAFYMSSLLAYFFRLHTVWFKLRVRGTLRVRFEVTCVNVRQIQYIRCLNLLNPSTVSTFICCRSIKLGRDIQSKALDLFWHLSGIALVISELCSLLVFLLMIKALRRRPRAFFLPHLVT